MPPYCKLHNTFHTTEECASEKARAARTWLAATKERQAAERQKRAERIAARVWKDHTLNGGSIQDMLTAAALAALTETENTK